MDINRVHCPLQGNRAMEETDNKVTSYGPIKCCDGQTARSQDEGFLSQTGEARQRKLPRGVCP